MPIDTMENLRTKIRLTSSHSHFIMADEHHKAMVALTELSGLPRPPPNASTTGSDTKYSGPL